MVAENVKNIRRRIEGACARSGRSAKDVTLVAVAKTFPGSMIRETVKADVIDIGENYVQELVRKHEELEDSNIRWHFVGHLQTNKAKYIAGWIHLVQSVDSAHLGREISKQAVRLGRTVDVLVEVNTSGEATKFGVKPEETKTLVQELSKLDSLRVVGLMTIGPFPVSAGAVPDAESSRASFRMLHQLRDSIQQKGLALPHLSMGMTNDFEAAIEEGATIIRIGTAIFGRRAKPDANNATRKGQP